MPEKCNNFLQFFLGFILAGHIGKRHANSFVGVDARAALAKGHDATPGPQATHGEHPDGHEHQCR